MRRGFPNWKTRCASLDERGNSEEKQWLALYSLSAEKHEHDRNKRADCKTEKPAYPPEPQKQTAAQAGPLNGGNASEKQSSAFEGNSYHNGTGAATRAARWYAENRGICPHPIIATLRRMFGLSALEAVQAIREANGGAR